MKNPTLLEKRNDRIAQMRALVGIKTLDEIGKMQNPPISRARVGQLVGRVRSVLPQSMRLLEVYRFIEWFIEENGYPPTVSEIGQEFRTREDQPTSSSVVHAWLSKMESETYDMIFPRKRNAARTIVLKNLNKRLPNIRRLLQMEINRKKE